MKTKNGLKVTDIGVDDFSRVIFKADDKDKTLFVLVSAKKGLHTMTDCGEPDYPLSKEYQLDDESLDELWDMYGGKAVL